MNEETIKLEAMALLLSLNAGPTAEEIEYVINFEVTRAHDEGYRCESSADLFTLILDNAAFYLLNGLGHKNKSLRREQLRFFLLWGKLSLMILENGYPRSDLEDVLPKQEAV